MTVRRSLLIRNSHNSFCSLRTTLHTQIRYDDEDEDEGPQPDPTLEQGVPIPVRLQGSFPPELASTPLEDIDPYYSNILVSQLLIFIYLFYIFAIYEWAG